MSGPNICLTGKPVPRSGLARFVRERAKRVAQTVTKGAVRLKQLLEALCVIIYSDHFKEYVMGILKDQMISNMKLHGYSEKTIKTYTSCVQAFSYYFNKSPLDIVEEEIQNFILCLRTAHKSDSTIHIYYESIKYFYKMHNQLYKLPKISFPGIYNKIPIVLSKSEIQEILQKCKSLKYKTIITIIYSAGLRISEATNLKLSDIDFTRKIILIRNGKNKKDRYTILANEAMILLKQYLTVYNPANYLFYTKDIWNRISTDCIQKYFKKLITLCGFNSSIHIHTLRHCFATHLLEGGTSIFYIMNLLGHSNIQTTMVYLHMQSLDKLCIKSPIDNMNISLCNDTNNGNSLLLESA